MYDYFDFHHTFACSQKIVTVLCLVHDRSQTAENFTFRLMYLTNSWYDTGILPNFLEYLSKLFFMPLIVVWLWQ